MKNAAKRNRRAKGATIVHVSTITGMHRVQGNSVGKRFVLCSTNDDKNVWVQRASILDLDSSLSRSLVFSETHNNWPSMRGGRPSALPESPNEGAVAYNGDGTGDGDGDDHSSSPTRYKERIQRLEEQVGRLERRLCDDAPTTILVDFMRRLEEKVDVMMILKGASTNHYTPMSPNVLPSYQPTATFTAQTSPTYASIPPSVFETETDAENPSNTAIHSQDSYGFDEALLRSASILSFGSASV